MANSTTRGKPFKKGQSGNPAGRPKGSSNKKELTLEEEIEGTGSDPAEAGMRDRKQRLGDAGIVFPA